MSTESTQYGAIPWTPGRGESIDQALRSEVILLREIVRHLPYHPVHDRPWMQHSPCDEAYERAWHEDVTTDYMRVPGDA